MSHTISTLSGAEFASLAVLVVAVALVLQPLQLGLVRLLEGYWPKVGFLAHATAWAKDRQGNHWEDLRRATTISAENVGSDATATAQLDASRWAIAFPPSKDRVLPTRLGNALRAAEDRGGRPYGLDTVTAWPRLYPLLPDRLSAIIDDGRDQLDYSSRFVATFAIGAIGSLMLLAAHGGWWLVLPAILAALTWLSYAAAVAAARAYGQSVCAAFDLHRFALFTAAHIALPPNGATEQQLGERLTRLWSLRDVALVTPMTYDHGEQSRQL
ncbi:hypothetical protein F0344_25745 [Streptomyces finlayi]|uniref:Uncharacterized protein n=1 Tax=Streptomyces finlayi TaxID=67296 RepID=A0A7G7BQD1_9ACTN|nr:hypothetical protein [Streptomyces finlayi]QNE77546.1 hypothetical protein F0344_25745 [Streptomyces finlayi]